MLAATKMPAVATAIVAAVLSLPAGGVAAQTPTQTPAATQTLPEVNVSVYANQTPTDIAKTGASTTILTGDEMRAQGYTDLPSALRSVAGVEVSQSGPRGALTYVSIRGSQAKHVLVLVDGVPMNELHSGAFDFADFEMEGIERVEVIRGPQSGIHGANANAGVIAITTISGRGRPSGARLRVEGGSRETGMVAATVHGNAGPVYGALSIDRHTTDGYSVSRIGDSRNGSYRTAIGGTLGVDITPDINIEGSFRSVARTVSVDPQPGELVIPSVPFGTDYNDFKSTMARVSGEWKLFDGILVQNAGWSRYQDNFHSFDVMNGDYQTEGVRDQVNYKGTIYIPHSFFGEKQSLTYATDWRNERFFQHSDFFAFYPPGSAAFFAARPGRVRVGHAGEYTIDLPTRTTLTGALRRETHTGFADATTWRVTASQQLLEATRLHGSVGTGVTNPTIIDQYGFAPSAFIGNPDLKPERSFGWDIGWEQGWFDGRVVTDITYFGADFTDKIVSVATASPGVMTVMNAAGTSLKRGVEASIRINPADWISISANYTYTDTRLSTGEPELRQPRHKGSVAVATHWLDNRLHAQAGVVFNGTMPDTVFAFPSFVTGLPAYTIVNASLSYDITPYAQAYVRFENALNSRYEEVFSYRAPPRGIFAGLRLKTLP